ncbi:MAG TPA: FKBP-type peptidyl-prolyl cis-trans isomerase N-terminal domain-containing protein [Xanthomonadaceae bacterium]|nr:FKBP-type peptidyl-prolyl cis-trans isomerase N-terminal domain-containing protein [Xanthomonadaceae bacterium]
MRLRLLAVVVACLGSSVALAQDVTSDKGKISYAVGYDLGRSLVERGIDVDPATLQRAIQDGMARKPPALPLQQMTQVLRAMQQRLLAQAKADFDRAAITNKAASDRFIAQNRARLGVKTLANGIQYRVIEDGNGPAVRADGQVRILYRASISTGQEFATSYTTANAPPTTVVINESPLPGIKQILPMMRQGAHWEILLPPEQAYGSAPGSPIGPNQAVLFDIKIVEVGK